MLPWAKMASDLDSNPKIVRAGRNGREVFLFALRVVALRSVADRCTDSTGGLVSRAWLDPEYVARQLQMPVADAEDGLARALKEELLADEGEMISIVGYDDEWRPPLSGTERSRRSRARQRQGAGSNGDATPRNGRNARPESATPRREERRREERERSDQMAPSPPADLDVRFEQAKTLWSEQEDLRRGLVDDGIPCRPVTAGPGAGLDPVVLALVEFEVADCRHVLACFEAESRASRSARYFDGVSNWKPENMRRALAMTIDEARKRGDEKLARSQQGRGDAGPGRVLPLLDDGGGA